MTDARLKTLVIENFRSLRGKVVVPLDAQVVLVQDRDGRTAFTPPSTSRGSAILYQPTVSSRTCDGRWKARPY